MMNKILEKIKEEKRTYITDSELAILLELDLDEAINFIENVSEKVDKFSIDKNFVVNLKKEDDRYLLDRDTLIFLYTEFTFSSHNIRCKMLEAIRLLYLIQLEKNNQSDRENNWE